MLLKIQYDGTAEERQRIISENSNLKLIQEDNITEGNFLIFSDTVPNSEIEDMKQSIAELTLLIATLGG